MIHLVPPACLNHRWITSLPHRIPSQSHMILPTISPTPTPTARMLLRSLLTLGRSRPPFRPSQSQPDSSLPRRASLPWAPYLFHPMTLSTTPRATSFANPRTSITRSPSLLKPSSLCPRCPDPDLSITSTSGFGTSMISRPYRTVPAYMQATPSRPKPTECIGGQPIDSQIFLSQFVDIRCTYYIR